MDDTAEKVLDTIVFDIGSTFTKATAFAEKEGKLIWAGRAQAPTTVEDIGQGLQAAIKALAETLHCQAVTAKSLLSTSSAAGGLRMVAGKITFNRSPFNFFLNLGVIIHHQQRKVTRIKSFNQVSITPVIFGGMGHNPSRAYHIISTGYI